MQTKIYIPYSNSDAVYGFGYDGPEIMPEEYVEMEKKEYYTYKDGVFNTCLTQMGNNMSINNYKKRKINVNKQKIVYSNCTTFIRNSKNQDLTYEEVVDLCNNNSSTVLYIYLNEKEFSENEELEEDIKNWVVSGVKLWSSNNFTDEEKLFNLQKKDFKIDLGGDMQAILKGCKFIKLLSNILKDNKKPIVSSFAIIVERIMIYKYGNK